MENLPADCRQGWDEAASRTPLNKTTTAIYTVRTAGMAKLAYAADLKSAVRKDLGVRAPLPAPLSYTPPSSHTDTLQRCKWRQPSRAQVIRNAAPTTTP